MPLVLLLPSPCVVLIIAWPQKQLLVISGASHWNLLSHRSFAMNVSIYIMWAHAQDHRKWLFGQGEMWLARAADAQHVKVRRHLGVLRMKKLCVAEVGAITLATLIRQAGELPAVRDTLSGLEQAMQMMSAKYDELLSPTSKQEKTLASLERCVEQVKVTSEFGTSTC